MQRQRPEPQRRGGGMRPEEHLLAITLYQLGTQRLFAAALDRAFAQISNETIGKSIFDRPMMEIAGRVRRRKSPSPNA